MSLFDIETTYWSSKGKYQKAYDHFHSKLVPLRGNASTPEGELFRIMGKFYNRHFNDGDYYWDMVEDGYEPITSIEGIDKSFLRSLENKLYDSNYEYQLEKMADRCIRYVILKNSTPQKIMNPQTLRLVRIDTSLGQKILKDLGCKVEYNYDL